MVLLVITNYNDIIPHTPPSVNSFFKIYALFWSFWSFPRAHRISCSCHSPHPYTTAKFSTFAVSTPPILPSIHQKSLNFPFTNCSERSEPIVFYSRFTKNNTATAKVLSGAAKARRKASGAVSKQRLSAGGPPTGIMSSIQP